jgi:cytochrome c-type biogenesis protein CcmH
MVREPRLSSRHGVTTSGPPTLTLLIPCAVLVAYALLGNPSPAPAQAVRLTPEQETRARQIEERLVAVCCFRQALAEHQSDRADAMREELHSMMAEGATDEEIVERFVTKYGERVLLAPEARGFNALAYVMPALALLGGLVITLGFLRHARRGAPSAATPVAPSHGGSPSATDVDPDLRARMREELDRFDE